VLNTALAKLVETLADIAWIVVYGGAYLAQESGILDGFKKIRSDHTVVWLVE
jgi:hypothetical protein